MGNTILSDDAAGIITVRYLQSNFRFPEEIDFRETSWGGFRIIDLLRGYDYAIILDTIKTGKSDVGHIHHLTADDFRHTLRLNSFHDINFYTALKLAEKLNEKMPHDIDIYAIEIENNYSIAENLSEELRGCIGNFAYTVIEKLLNKRMLSEDFDSSFTGKTITDEELHSLYIETEINKAVNI